MDRFDAYLHSLFQDDIPSTVLEAMQYSLFAGGKRVRPQLCCWRSKGMGSTRNLAILWQPRSK